MKNEFKHNDDGTTTIYVESLDRVREVQISTEDFQILESRGYNICIYWDKVSRSWYARSNGKQLHRLLKGDPKGMQVHHKDGNGLNNTQENLEVVTPSEHASKRCPKEPIVGDPSKGIKVHILTKAESCRKDPERRYWFSLEVNGIHYGTFYDDINLNLHARISDMVVNDKASDEEIYVPFLRYGHKEENVAAVIKEVRKFFRTPDPAKQKVTVKK